MKPVPPPRINKPRFTVDINTSLKNLRKVYGGFATFISTATLTRSQATKDENIIKTANAKNYHIITHNTADFKNAPARFSWLEIGIICVNLQEGNYIDKFGKVLREFKKHDKFKGKLILLGNEIKVITYQEIRKDI